MPSLSSPRRSIAAVALVGCAAIGWPGCGTDERAAGPAAAPVEFVPESYPIRAIYVALRKNSKDPKFPPRTEAEADARVSEIVTRLAAPGASFEAVARETSDDPTSAADGGFAGFVADWAGDFESVLTAVRKLKPGEVSPPVATPLGREIVQRLSRDEGRAAEARYVVPVVAITAPWHDLVPTLPVDLSKAAAYEDAAKAVLRLRSKEASIDAVAGRLNGATVHAFPMRRAAPPGAERLTQAVFALAPGEVSDPVETPSGWVIATRLPYVRCYAQHILFTSEKSAKFVKPSSRSDDDARKLAATTLETLRKDPAAFDRLARELSDDPMSKNIGGFIGDLSNANPPPRRAAPVIEEAIFALKPGEIGEVVESDLGIHIVRRGD